MKKILYLLGLSFIISLITVSCEIDNYEGPNAQISGKFLDAITGDLVGTDITNGSSIGVYELGWASEAKQTWNIKNTGEYTNNLVFASTYRIEFTNCNFWPFIVNDFVVKKGANTYDFKVTPFIRVLNPSITYNAGGAGVTLNTIQLYGFTDIWVGNYISFGITAGGAQKKSPGAVPAAIATTQYTLTMDVSANATKFPVTRNYYFRIGALANIAGVGTVRWNYSPVTKINITRP
jgi:hypothetical protein